MELADLTDVALDAEARAECEAERANGIAAAAERFTIAWREWLNGARR